MAAATAGALGLLVGRGAQRTPLGAPAQEEIDEPCPEHVDTAAGAAVAVAADELIECPGTYDGGLVRYDGEVVRAVLRRGARAWVHLNDEPYALDLGPLHEHRTAVGGNSGIPVSVPVVVADAVSFVGDASHRGDILTVTGVFHRADPADGGGPTIQARAVRITQPGRVTARPLDRARALVAAGLSIAVLLATRIARQRRPLRPRAR